MLTVTIIVRYYNNIIYTQNLYRNKTINGLQKFNTVKGIYKKKPKAWFVLNTTLCDGAT